MALIDIVMVPAIAAIGIIFGLLFKGIDRIIAARMQARIGPPILQPFIDVKKLLLKENIVPKNAIAWLFNLMPAMALAVSIAMLFYIPIGSIAPLFDGQGDAILVLYLLAMPSLALAIGGFASGSHYATVGAQREMVTMIGYEFPLAITVISIAWALSFFSPSEAVFSLGFIASNPVWFLVGPLGFIGMLMLLAVLLFVMPAELGKIPFDAAEAETEIAGGVLVEYSGTNLALFYLADAVKTFAFASVIVALFLPFNISIALGIGGVNATALDFAFFLLKLFAVIFIGSTFISVAVARLRITQIVKVYWGYSTLFALVGLLLIWIDLLLKFGGA